MDEKARKVFIRLQAQCARREYCRSDVFTKALKALDGDRDAAEEVTGSLVADRFVDDFRYAAAFAREKASITGWGPVKIRFALCGKGVSREAVEEALEEIDGKKADDRMKKALEAKWRALKEDPQGKLKLLKFALSRGYEYDAVKQAVDDICRG